MDGFNLMLPYPAGVARLVLKKGAVEPAARTVSANAPQVNILSPVGGATWAATGTYTVTWTASDLDNDPLTTSVLYSPDGDNWVPVGTSITNTQLVVNSAELAGAGNARIRVMASDRINTTSVSLTPFSVGRKGPQATILSPNTSGSIMPGTPLFLTVTLMTWKIAHWVNRHYTGIPIETEILGQEARYWSLYRRDST